MVVVLRDHLRWLDSQPPSRWLDAITADRESEDYANDPDAWNGPVLRRDGRQEGT